MDTEFWFAVHRTFMTLVPIFTLTGFAAILYAKEFELIQPSLNANFVHSLLGFITIAFSIIQVKTKPTLSNLIYDLFSYLAYLWKFEAS